MLKCLSYHKKLLNRVKDTQLLTIRTKAVQFNLSKTRTNCLPVSKYSEERQIKDSKTCETKKSMSFLIRFSTAVSWAMYTRTYILIKRRKFKLIYHLHSKSLFLSKFVLQYRMTHFLLLKSNNKLE